MLITKIIPNSSKAKTFFMLFTIKLSTLAGYMIGSKLLTGTQMLQIVLMSFAAGMFIYMSTSDIVPEEMVGDKVLLKYLVFIAGVLVMVSATFMGEEHHHHDSL